MSLPPSEESEEDAVMLASKNRKVHEANAAKQ
jgi:hypothetical protein